MGIACGGNRCGDLNIIHEVACGWYDAVRTPGASAMTTRWKSVFASTCLFGALLAANASRAELGHICVAGCDSGGPPIQETPAPQLPPVGRISSASGQVMITNPDGSPGDGIIREGSRVVTGPSGHARFVLMDGTALTIGPGSELTVDEFIYDPRTDVHAITASIVKGFFRFVTGKIARHDPGQFKVKLAVGALGIRGTDFEIAAEVDGSGYIKLYSGMIELNPYDSDDTIELEPGQMLRFSNFTEVEGPLPIGGTAQDDDD